jgi:hypothetical protein
MHSIGRRLVGEIFDPSMQNGQKTSYSSGKMRFQLVLNCFSNKSVLKEARIHPPFG